MSEHRIECYTDIPAQTVYAGYDFQGKASEAYSSCHRWGIPDTPGGYMDALLTALRRGIDEAVQARPNAEKFTVRVCPKNGPPSLTVEYDSSW